VTLPPRGRSLLTERVRMRLRVRPARPVSPFPAAVEAAAARRRRGTAPPTVREPATPFLVLRRGPDDAGARPATGGADTYAFRFEDVDVPGVACTTPQPGRRYRFRTTVTNLGTVPASLGMVEIYGGGSWQYPGGMRLFAMAPFACPALASVEVVVVAVVPDAVLAVANQLVVQAFDLMQDPVARPLDPVNDRHVIAVTVNKI